MLPRLDRSEISQLKRRLAEWQSPDAMGSVVDDIMNRIGSANLFNQGGLAFLRDAWIASEFAHARQAEQVRLSGDIWPDSDLLQGDRVDRFEAVEADDPLRRRGDEYRLDIGAVKDDPVEDWITRAEQAPIWLEVACRKKAAKNYGARANLVIYLNLNEYGIRQNEIECSFPAATSDVKDNFESIWILWKMRAYRVW